MRKIFTIILAILSFCVCHAQYVDIPDAQFRAMLMAKYPSCFNGAQQMNSSCTQITSEDSLEFHGIVPALPLYEAVNIDGIQYFTSLKYLDCSRNFISLSPPLPSSLLYLDFSHSYGSPGDGFLPVMPATLKHLNCSADLLYSANFPAGLKFLDCSYNIFSTGAFPALPSGLDTLICGGQNSLSPNTNILTALPPLPANLKVLDCSDNALTSLPTLPIGLTWLNCASNNYHTDPETYFPSLASLPLLPTTLTYLNCASNKLTALPPLPASLIYLDCSNNVFWRVVPPYDTLNFGISLLPRLPINLAYLNCAGNAIHCLPRIPLSLTSLQLDRELVTCLPNSGNYTVYPAGPTIPLCNAITNSNGCSFSSILSGTVFYDNNSNGTKDPGEYFRENVRLIHSNGTNTFTNSNGYFEMTGDIGPNTISIDPLPFYNAVPASKSYTLNTYDSLLVQQFALQKNILADSMSVSLVPLNTPRPGFTFRYKVNFENVGTTTVSPGIVLHYDHTRLTYASSSNAAVINTGTSLTLSETNFVPGMRDNFTANFTVNPSTALGDSIFAKAVITGGTNSSTDSGFSVVRGSLDPNDKTATPKLTSTQVTQGEYIHYIIRFQNTGTDTAFNVVLTDNLSSLLLESSFQLLGASAPCKVTRNGALLTFEFLNIKLPYTGINEPLSHGFVYFRIKPRQTASTNVVIANSANIYFDFNSPILTNTANTLINISSVPLTLLSFKGYATHDNQAMLSWQTADELNTKAFQIEQATDQRNFSFLKSVPAQGNRQNNYLEEVTLPGAPVYYRLKMVDFDGRFAYSKIVKLGKEKGEAGIILLSNPAAKQIEILLSDQSLLDTRAVLINSGGMTVQSIILKGRTIMNVGDLAAGVYFFKTASGVQKLVIAP